MRTIRNYIVKFACSIVANAGAKSLSPCLYENLLEAIDWILITRNLKPNPLLQEDNQDL